MTDRRATEATEATNDANGRMYGYSYDGETYRGKLPTREAALEEARRECADSYMVYTCEGIPVDLGLEARLDADDIIERINDNAETIDDVFASVTTQQKAELTNALRATIDEWIAKVGVSYYTADHVEKHVVKPELEDA